MSRTDISAASLADYLRRKAGDGGMEWCYEPVQTSVLLDIADMLDENAKLRELVSGLEYCVQGFVCDCCPLYDPSCTNHRRCESLERELGVEVDDAVDDA